MRSRTIIGIAVAFTLISASIAVLTLHPRPAQATTGWHWWDAIEDQQNHHPSCPANPPDKAEWEDALDGQDNPHWTELTVYFIAYPCSAGPTKFIEYRDWLNYEIHDQGTWDPDWATTNFHKLKDLVYELDESPSGYWADGPWD